MTQKTSPRRPTGLLAAVWLSSLLTLPALAQLPPEQHYGGTTYVTGGFGLDESTALKEAMGRYALALTLAQQQPDGRAAYLANAQIVVRDTADQTVLNAEARGPMLLAQLPPGRYQLHATVGQHTLSREISIQAGATTRLNLVWPPAEAP